MNFTIRPFKFQIMETFNKNDHQTAAITDINRREFLKRGVMIGAFTGVAGLSLVTACKEEGEGGVGPSEDLMREHGVLNRIMLIYDTCRIHLANGEQFPLVILKNSAQIIRNFIEDYHEKLEEDFLFPLFEKATQLTVLVQVLSVQHKAGRILTDRIIESGKMNSWPGPEESQKLIRLLNDFNSMYRPHEAREDTVLFPALRKIVSTNEYLALGEKFEDKEQALFGKDGFGTVVEKVAGIEQQLGIYELSKFTPGA